MNSLEGLEVVVSFSLQVALLTLTTLVVERSCCNSRLKSRLWTTCFVSLLALFAAALLFPHAKWFQPWQTFEPSELMQVATAESKLGIVLLSGWIIGSGLAFLSWFANTVRLEQMIRHAEPLTKADSQWVGRATQDLCLSVNGRPVNFFYCDEHSGPFCYQLHQPMIFLPRDVLQRLSSSGQLDGVNHIIRHEMAHLSTHHPMQLFLQSTLECLLWFHPMVRVGGRRAALVREFVCDDIASGQGSQTLSYIRTLLEITTSVSRQQPGTLGINRTTSELVHRTKRLAQNHASLSQPWSQMKSHRYTALAPATIVATMLALTQCWLPLNPLTSTKSKWSPWPTWTAACLHEIGVNAPDFEPFDDRSNLYELWSQSATVHEE